MDLRSWFRYIVPKLPVAARHTALPLSLLGLALTGPTAAAAGQVEPPSAEVFGTLPASTDVVMTPNGQRLAWIDQHLAKPRVVMFDIAARRELRILALPENMKARSILWNDNETLIITFSETQGAAVDAQKFHEYFMNIAYDASGGEGRLLPSTGNNSASAAAWSSIIRTRLNKPHTVIMETRVCGIGGCVFEVDTNTGQETVLRYGAEHTVGWVVGRDGIPVAREDWDWRSHAYRIYALSGEKIREILHKDDSEPPSLAGILPDNSALVLLAPNGRSYQAAWALPLDGSPLRLLAEDSEADITKVYEDSYTGAVIGVYVSGTQPHIHWLDPEARHRAELVGRPFPNKTVDIYGWSADGARTLAEVQSGSSPPVYYLVDFSTHRAEIAAESYAALENVPLGELRQISYEARDGMSIPAYLTLPPGKPAGPVPLVVLPHDWPQERDYPRFHWIVQFLATRGYAVLQPQFRGSIGFGKAFEKAGYRQWGGLMQDDLTDGVQAMVAQGIADPRHIAIVGFEYGGYTALAGAAFMPTLYSCAASVYGISDLRAFVQGSMLFRTVSTSESWFKERVGSASDSAMRTRSPVNAVEAIRIPVFIAYGTPAGYVLNDQSERMAAALTKAGKPITVVKLPPEGMLSSQNRVQLLKALESFLHDHI